MGVVHGDFEYVVVVGKKEVIVKTQMEVDPSFVCALAIERSKPKSIGQIVSVRGGHLDDEYYVLTENACRMLGRWK